MAEQGTARFSNLVDSTVAINDDRWPEYVDEQDGGVTKDHFVDHDEQPYAGKHLILDFWGARELDNAVLMEQALRTCVREAGATLLHIHLHLSVR